MAEASKIEYRERPILFSAPMVRASIRQADPKTQTRRGVTRLTGFGLITEFGRSDTNGYDWHFRDKQMRWHDIDHARLLQCCPYGQPGDRLWVKETLYAFGRWETRFNPEKGRDEWHFIDMTLENGLAYRYAADSDEVPHMLGRKEAGTLPMWWKRPAIFMPRWASRITLEITGVRVERLQDISEADAEAEGARECDITGREVILAPPSQRGSYVRHYRDIWETINGPGSWDANPWVWVIEFRRLTA